MVVGSRGMTGVRRVLGRVPNVVAHYAHRSVMVVDATEEPQPRRRAHEPPRALPLAASFCLVDHRA